MGKKKTRRQKNDELRRRYDAVKNLMSTFAMSTVAVVAVVTLIPASPKAEIVKTVALSEEITYQVTVTDEENALDLDSLQVVLENQLEYYEHPIELGESSGYFDDLETNTQYRLSVYGDKGFGSERLDTELITTRPNVGGTILGVEPVTDFHNTTYLVDVSIYDPDNEYSNIQFFYGYSWEPDTDLTYSSIPISTLNETIELMDIFTDYPFHIYIEATTIDGDVILDEMWITPPFVLFTELYIAYYNNTEIAFHTYGTDQVNDLKYTMNIYRGNTVIKTEEYYPSNDHYSTNKWLIDKLLPNTTYRFECIATYTNPQTLRVDEIVIYNEELTTTLDYSYTYDFEEFDDSIEITVYLTDPDNILHYVYYEVLDTSEEWDVYVDGESFNFEVDGETKFYTFTITIPLIDNYEIYIGMRNYDDTYIRQTIKEIKVTKEE